MANNTATRIRKNGIYYTPANLAEFLAKPLLQDKNLTILDPAYGEGALLLAAERLLKDMYSARRVGAMLFGCDKAPLNGLLKHLPYSNLRQMDFFDMKADQKYDVVLMNPPYVRHHAISYSNIKKYQKITAPLCELRTTSDLWAYFLVQAVIHLNKGGSVGAILPWSFLQAAYAQPLRQWLAERFSDIKILALGADYFDNAQERVVMVWLRKFGEPAKSIKIGFSQHIGKNIQYTSVSADRWNADAVVFSKRHDLDKIIAKFIEEYGFRRFEDVALVKIGVVTGADEFFILDQSRSGAPSFSKKDMVPIISSARDLTGLLLNGNSSAKQLIILKRTTALHEKYIRKGVREKYNVRAHSLRRKPWYRIDPGATPDAFFPYRVHQLPYLTRNDKGIQCTNSIHRIYFKNLSEVEVKWVQVSLLAVPGQLSLETASKNYGSGVLKVEPKSLKEALVYYSKSRAINTVYDEISKLVSLNKRAEAVKRATEFLYGHIGISQYLSRIAASALLELQRRRLDR